MDLFYNISNFIIHDVYSIYLVILLIVCGLVSFFYDTDHNYLFGHYKDYITSFFFGIFNIAFAIILILIKFIYSRLVL